ncbi:MAG: hypothetical protein WAO58_02500 [Fimbriimonadaceae bacterium]
MRVPIPLLTLLAATLGVNLAAQQPTTPKGDLSLFLTMRPDVIVTVQARQGGELVEIRTGKPGYPTELLTEQISKLSQLLGRQATIEYIQRAQDKTLAARFGIVGLVDERARLYRLAPLAKAFAGAPAPYTIQGIHITLNGEKGYEGDIGRYARPGAFEIEALRSEGGPLPMLEYRIKLLTQDPRQLDIPEKFEKPASPTVERPNQTSPVLFYVLLGVAAAAAGVLVYLALLRASTRKR